MDYNDFLLTKKRQETSVGFNPQNLHNDLFQFQKDIVSWACKRGRSALFAGTGMGKTFMQLSWANELHAATKGKILIFTPLAVANQTLKESNHWGFDASKASCMEEVKSPITITNYQKLHHFDLSKFEGVILDESSILKNESGYYSQALVDGCSVVPYRLAATATPSPNDFMELGNHSAFCGIMSYTDMLSTFFTHDGSSTQNWRLKGHAESEFWKWMATWSCMFAHPRDIGYDNENYNLPKLHQIQHIVDVKYEPCIETGMLFPLQAQSLSERIAARRATIDDRVNKAAEIANDSKECFVVWCNLNDESKMLAQKINGAVELSGADSEQKKEDKLNQFAEGNIRVLITKPSLCGAGMNWQHCHNTIFVGLNDSFEQIYQAIRRFWRFGQKNEVFAHFIASEIEGAVVSNIKRKEDQAEHMMQQMIKNMSDFTSDNIKGAVRETALYQPNKQLELPKWI
jgi:Helicase conserved C-terminal domain